MGRKTLLKSTEKNVKKNLNTTGPREARQKKAILDGLPKCPGSIKANLEKIGLSQSTYYGWSKRYKAQGLDGLTAGSPVAESVWKRFNALQKEPGQTLVPKSKAKVEEKQTMTNQKDDKKKRDLLFKKFDEEPAAASPKKGEGTGAKEAKPAVAPSYSPPPEEPMDKTLKYAIGAFVGVLVILLMASFSNSNRFYFKTADKKVELWQGRFAPMGEKLVATFPDQSVLKGLPSREYYSRSQVYGAVFDYFLTQADDVLNTSRTPDLKAVKSYLTQASRYARSGSERRAVQLRLNSIDFLVLSGKADLAVAKGTMEGFEAAKKFLHDALAFATTDIQKDMVTKRLAAIEYAMASNKISKGEKQLAMLYREALSRHLQKAKQYNPEKSKEIDQEISKINKWLNEFDKRHVGGAAS